ncbi:hypothetical protein tinsulaeT_38310 [Thalassotalea insulae]|uniref:START domain-containing protein n=1 Tax=Thalassotalea insulae TaxID=2056778 RepID=A0ABQ6H0U1_9GAMM|nr:hypothetical protein tinsulaeT_38310 [Thalassotalea insulae]
MILLSLLPFDNSVFASPIKQLVPPDKAQWSVWREANNMKISTRPVSRNGLIEIKAELSIRTSKMTFIEFITKPHNLALWLDNLKSSEIKSINIDESELTIRFNAIWPLAERIMRIKSTIKSRDDASILIQLTDTGDKLDHEKGSIVVTVHAAHWLISPLDNETLLVSYQFIADANGSIPKWLANKLMLNSIWKSLLNIKQHITISSRTKRASIKSDAVTKADAK